MSIFANVAEISAERMEELAGQASLRDAGTTAGIATDKLLALSGDQALTIRHEHFHEITKDDIVAFAIARSKRNQKPIDAEIVTDASVGGDARETHLLVEKTQSKKKVPLKRR